MGHPLVSILIPAHNTEEYIAEAIQSAIGQTWPCKEIIVIDDGSTDRTAQVAGRFASAEVLVASRENRGAAATRNYAFNLCQGEFIQWLDADDVLAPDKVERQLVALEKGHSRRTLLSSSWAYFNYRTRRAHFVPNILWQDHSPVEWLLATMGQGLYMQTATWLTSRELAEAAGPWNARLLSDDDREYFCRVLLASEGTHFVQDARVFYRNTSSKRLSHIGTSDKKKEALLLSMDLQVQHLRSLEESERTRKACLAYLQTWCTTFYPERPDLFAEAQAIAAKLNGRLESPRLLRKYAWMEPVFGYNAAKWIQTELPLFQASLVRQWDMVMHRLETWTSSSRSQSHYPVSECKSLAGPIRG